MEQRTEGPRNAYVDRRILGRIPAKPFTQIEPSMVGYDCSFGVDFGAGISALTHLALREAQGQKTA